MGGEMNLEAKHLELQTVDKGQKTVDKLSELGKTI
jgi:hypothetical protein